MIACFTAGVNGFLWGDATWQRVLWLQDHNTRVVLLGVTLLGLACGVVGCFALMRRRALLGDALSHATLPGIALAYLIVNQLGGDGKQLHWLLLGAALSGTAAMIVLALLRRTTRLKEDTTMGMVLSVFFGAGTALLAIVQQLPDGSAAGLEGFIYGKTASLLPSDAWRIAIVAIVVLSMIGMLFKEFKLLCFDEAGAAAQGFPILLLDGLLMLLVAVVTIVGLQAVGLVLVIALLVVPAAAAQFWTQRLSTAVVIAGVLGALSGYLGAMLSGALSNLPSGALVVLVAVAMFLASLLLGPVDGLLVRFWNRSQTRRRSDARHVLRAMYEWLELKEQAPDRLGKQRSAEVPLEGVLQARSWSLEQMQRAIRTTTNRGWVESNGPAIRLTADGAREASRVVHEHRLWELYLITHAEVATSRVDADADAIEHVLGPELVDQLEQLLSTQRGAVLASPHAIETRAPSDPRDWKGAT
jgi:manganese/zinc/iron transport system permease protein